MWIVIYLSPSKAAADQIKTLLQAAGLLVKVRAVSSGEQYGCYEILVPESEVNEAHGRIINELL